MQNMDSDLNKLDILLDLSSNLSERGVIYIL